MRTEDQPHEPGCLGNHRGDCAVSGYFTSHFVDDRHNLYVGWVLGIAWNNGLPAEPVLDAAGNYTDRIVFPFDPDGQVRFTLVVPPPPPEWVP